MTELVKYQDVDLENLQRMASMLAASGYFESSADGKTAIAQMATKILAGRELGYGPFASVQGIHVIKGKPALSANLMAAAVKAHPRYDYKVRKMANDEVVIEFFENGESIGSSSFTLKDANAAGTQNLQKFARNMLFARAMSNGVRWYCPDVFYGNAVYTPEELGATVDGDGNIDAKFTVVNDRKVDTVTGEIVEPTPANVNGNATPSPVDDISTTWQEEADALRWGFSSEVFAAKPHCSNAYNKIKAENPTADIKQIYKLWIDDVNRRVAEKKAELVAA